MSLGTSDSGITAPMNINSVLAHLVKMTPQQRQQFAQNHSDDPLMLSAAKFVDNQIKDQAQAYMAQQNGAPSKVNQQVVAAMAPPQQHQAAQTLPENSGIAQLPAPNMQGMAGGGIVAFDDGGTVVDQARAQRDAIQQKLYTYGLRQRQQDPAGFQATQEAFQAAQEAVQAAEKNYATEMAPMGINRPISNESPIGSAREYQSGGPHPRPRSPQATVQPAATMPTDATRRTDIRFPGGAPALTSVSAPVGQRDAGPGAGPALPPSQPAQSQQGLAALQASLMPKGPGVDPYAEQHATMASREEVQGQLELADAQQRQAGLAGILEPREARLKGREDRIQKTEDLSTKMAVINAGLAMMQSTGKGLAGIAEGATVGTKQYVEGMKASEAARQKMEDARDAFEEFRYNAGNMSQKEITAAKRAITTGKNAADQIGITAQATDLAQKRTMGNTLFEATVNERNSAADRASRERTAAFSAQVQKEIAAMPGANERLYSTLGGGDVKKGFDYLNAATAEGKGDEAIMQAVIKSPEILGAINPALRKVIEQRIADRFAPQVQNKAGDRP
jgi:hypothetical protein